MEKKTLEINEDIKHEQLKWKFERVGWTIMLLIAVAALMGLLGSGPISSKVIKNNHITVEYNYFERNNSQCKFIIYTSPQSDEDSTITVNVNKELLNKIKLEKIAPEPIKTSISNHAIHYEFSLSKNTREIKIILYFEPEQAGFNNVELATSTGRLQFTQFFYP